MRPTGRLLALIAGLMLLRLTAYALLGGSPADWGQNYCHLDCKWYVNLARDGYDLAPRVTPPQVYAEANWAFFPVYPLLVRLFVLASGLSYPAAGLLVANLFLFLFVVLAVAYLPRVRPGTNRVALACFLLAFPYGLYFSVPYTESLYAFFTVAGLYLLSCERNGAAALAGTLMSATRVTGVLLAPMMAVRLLAPALADWRRGETRIALTRAADALLPIAVAPLGLFLFMALLYARTGDALAFAHVQAGWDRQTGFPLFPLVNNLFAHDWWRAFSEDRQSVVVSEYAALAGLAVCLRLWRLRLWPELWLLGGTLTLALSAGLLSMQRLVFANPIFLLFLFDWLWQSALVRRFFPVLLLFCAALQLCFVHFWLKAYAFLM
jgi:hypothetical protein